MIQHTQDCDDLMTGRALRSIIDQDMRTRSISLPELTARRDAMRAFEADGRCDCAALRLNHIMTLLTTTRKRLKGWTGEADQAALRATEAELIAERAEIRAYLTARNAAV